MSSIVSFESPTRKSFELQQAKVPLSLLGDALIRSRNYSSARSPWSEFFDALEHIRDLRVCGGEDTQRWRKRAARARCQRWKRERLMFQNPRQQRPPCTPCPNLRCGCPGNYVFRPCKNLTQ